MICPDCGEEYDPDEFVHEDEWIDGEGKVHCRWYSREAVIRP